MHTFSFEEFQITGAKGWSYTAQGIWFIPELPSEMDHIADGLKACDQLVLDFLHQPSNFALEKGVHMEKEPEKKILQVNFKFFMIIGNSTH